MQVHRSIWLSTLHNYKEQHNVSVTVLQAYWMWINKQSPSDRSTNSPVINMQIISMNPQCTSVKCIPFKPPIKWTVFFTTHEEQVVMMFKEYWLVYCTFWCEYHIKPHCKCDSRQLPNQPLNTHFNVLHKTVGERISVWRNAFNSLTTY